MKTAYFFIFTAVLEVAAGVALLCFPGSALLLLLGNATPPAKAILAARLIGSILLVAAVLIILLRNRKGRALSGVFLVYNTLVAVTLSSIALFLDKAGVALWPVAGIHALMAIWCISVYGSRLTS